MITPRDKLEPRGENEPKFDPHNKTDRKILTIVLVTCGILTVVAVGLILVYFLAR